MLSKIKIKNLFRDLSLNNNIIFLCEKVGNVHPGDKIVISPTTQLEIYEIERHPLFNDVNVFITQESLKGLELRNLIGKEFDVISNQ